MYNFNAEVSKVLKLVIHSLYTNKDVFLRELISNGSDACEKLRYLLATNQVAATGEYMPRIEVLLNKENNTITIRDNGIGMNKDELIHHLGTIAKSGTEQFAKSLNNATSASELIGQFGVGFYSCFMVADRVEFKTRRYGEMQSFLWKSDGESGFEIEELQDNSLDYGSEITLFIKEEEKDTYINEFKIEHIIKTYSAHVSVPVEFIHDGDVVSQINPEKAIWLREKAEITQEQYKDFFKSLSHLPTEPLSIIHNRVEGNFEFVNLLYIPTSKPFDLYHPDRETKVKLYVRHVFISEKNMDIIPKYLRFVYGIIDSNDLPLNVSRETLQDSRMLQKIKDNITKKILTELEHKAEEDKETYNDFWLNFGPILKEGLCEGLADREKLMKLLRFYTTKSQHNLISMEDYVEKMKNEQKDIYYFVGDKKEDMLNAPEIEVFIKNDIEVILLTDPVDSFWLSVVHDYKAKDLKSITRADINLDKIAKEEKKDEKEKESESEMTAVFMDALKGKVAAVKISNKLTESPSCLSINPGAMDIRMEQMLLDQHQIQKRALKILEINPENSLVKTVIDEAKNGNHEKSKQMAETIFEFAAIAQGEHLDNMGSFIKKISKIVDFSKF
jgi:molecular chaperone HtpG